MKRLTIPTLQSYLFSHYGATGNEQSLFMKLVEEMGEAAEVLNIRAGRKAGAEGSNEALGKELADIIHYAAAIAAINRIDLEKVIIEKDRQASVKYHHDINLADFMEKEGWTTGG